MRILAVSGSLQQASGNQVLLRTAAALAPPGVEVVLHDGVRHLPHFDPDVDQAGAPPPVEEWRAALRDSDAVLIACPEYGHSLPGALKNAIDWVIGSGELHRKVVGVTAAVPSRDRGLRGLGALEQTLLAVDADIVGGVPIARGPDFEAGVRELLLEVIERARTSREPAEPVARVPSERPIHRGDIFWIAPDDSRGPAPDYSHPHVVLQDDALNRSRISTVVVCALTSNLGKASEPGNVLLSPGEGDLPKQSVIVVSQVASVEKARLGERIGALGEARVEQALDGLRFQQRAFFRG